MKVDIPSQLVHIDTPNGIDPVWYAQLKRLADFSNLFSLVDPNTLTNGQVLIWDSTLKKFKPGAN